MRVVLYAYLTFFAKNVCTIKKFCTFASVFLVNTHFYCSISLPNYHLERDFTEQNSDIQWSVRFKRRLTHRISEAVVGLAEIWRVCAFLCAYASGAFRHISPIPATFLSDRLPVSLQVIGYASARKHGMGVSFL